MLLGERGIGWLAQRCKVDKTSHPYAGLAAGVLVGPVLVDGAGTLRDCLWASMDARKQKEFQGSCG